TRCYRDWSSDVCSSDLKAALEWLPIEQTLARFENIVTGKFAADFVEKFHWSQIFSLVLVRGRVPTFGAERSILRGYPLLSHPKPGRSEGLDPSWAKQCLSCLLRTG